MTSFLGRVSRLDAFGVAALAVLAALLPFELKTPLFSLGPVVVTSVELVLYVTLLAWGVGWLRRRRLRWTPAHAAVLAWMAVITLSAIVAPADRALALKFAARSLTGCFLFFVAADLVTAPGRAALMMAALAAGAAVSALAAVAEMWLPGAAAALMAFKTQPSMIGGFPRASGTFQYANIAAMYWEAAVPLVLTIGLWLGWRRALPSWRWAAVAVTLVLAEAVVLSLSRAGLFVTVFALVALAGLGRRRLQAVRGPASVSLIGLVALALLNPRISGLMALRVGTSDEPTWYRAEYRSVPSSLTIEAGQTAAVNVTVRNTGLVIWPASGGGRVGLSYHWQHASGDPAVILDGLRSELPADVAPGTEVAVPARVLAPRRPGQYVLRWDLVQENVLWFSMRGARTGILPVEVTLAARTLPSAPDPPWVRIPTELRPPRMKLWSAGLRMWGERPLVGIGPDNFRHRYGPYLGLKRFDDRIHTNSLYVETLVNLGLLGVVALAGLMMTLALTVGRAWRTRDDPQVFILVLGLLVSLATFFVHGMVDYFLEFTPTFGLYWLLAGTAVGVLREERSC